MENSPDNGVSSVLSIEYTALMLIILTFVIGVQFSPNGPRASYAEEASDSKRYAALSVNKVFHDGQIEVDMEPLYSITELVQSHDINAEIEVFTSKTDGVDFGLTIARSVMLYKAFLKLGVPPEAVNVIASPQSLEGAQIRAHFIPFEGRV